MVRDVRDAPRKTKADRIRDWLDRLQAVDRIHRKSRNTPEVIYIDIETRSTLPLDTVKKKRES